MPHLHNPLRTPEATPSGSSAGGHTHTYVRHTQGPAITVIAILVLACLGLAACGGSSGSSTNAAATGSTAPSTSGTSTTGGTTQGAAPGAGRQRFSAIRECLQKNGVTLPKRTPGSSGPGGAAGGPGGAGGFPGTGGGPVLPKGMTRAQFEAALKKCGGSNFGARSGRPGGAGFRRVNNPVFEQALAKYAACLRQNGIDIPAPNTSGKGPIFSTKGIDTTSPQFKTATMKCRASLVGAFRGQRGSGGAAGTSTTPAGGESSG
jgi:hypothetical protein